MATVSLRDYLSTGDPLRSSGGLPATGPGLVPLRDVLARSSPVDSGAPGAPTGRVPQPQTVQPSGATFGQGLGIARALATAGGTGTRLAQETGVVGTGPGTYGATLGAAFQGAGVLGGLAGGAYDLSRGRIGPGALSLANAGFQGARLLAPAGSQAANTLASVAPLANIAAGGLAAGLRGHFGEQAEHSYQVREAIENMGLMETLFGGPGAEAGGLAGSVIPGAGLVVTPVVNLLQKTGLFGEHRSRSQALKAESTEAGRHGDELRAPIALYEKAANLDEFFQAQGAVGYIQGSPAEFVKRALTDPASIMAASAPTGPSMLGVRSSLLVPSIEALATSAIDNARRLMQQPGALTALAKAEYQYQRRQIDADLRERQKGQPVGYDAATGEPIYQNVELPKDPASRAPLEQQIAQARARALGPLDQQFSQDPFSLLPPDFRPPATSPSGAISLRAYLGGRGQAPTLAA